MKNIYIVLLFSVILIFFISCGAPLKPQETAEAPFVTSQQIQQIDSLMQHYPDSALQKLMSFNTDSCFAKISSFDGKISSVFNENYRHVLLSEALYKTDHQQYNHVELQDAMHYFDSDDPMPITIKHIVDNQ